MSCEKDGHKFYVCLKAVTKDPDLIHIFKECVYCSDGIHHSYEMPNAVFWVDTPEREIKE